MSEAVVHFFDGERQNARAMRQVQGHGNILKGDGRLYIMEKRRDRGHDIGRHARKHIAALARVGGRLAAPDAA